MYIENSLKICLTDQKQSYTLKSSERRSLNLTKKEKEMGQPETMKIDDVEYVRKDSVINEPVDETTEPLRIIMNDDRGLCLVGNVDLSGDNWLVKIKNARCIIRWGTSEHLAELADKGPMENTRLGYKYTHTMPRDRISLIIDCKKGAWDE